jgi:DNA-binding PadR family transcriptional regulator
MAAMTNGYSNSNSSVSIPITPSVFHILLALAGADLHGYGIMLAVDQATDGEVQIPLGTLYRSIKQMLQAGCIERTEARTNHDAQDPRRQVYRITAAGREVASREARRLARVVDIARQRNLVGAPQSL